MVNVSDNPKVNELRRDALQEEETKAYQKHIDAPTTHSQKRCGSKLRRTWMNGIKQ